MSSLATNSPRGNSQHQSSSLPSYRIKDPELTKVVINQLSILLTTLTNENIESHFKQIRFILDKQVSNPIVIDNYFDKLISLIRFASFATTEELSPIEKLFAKELTHISKDLNYLELLFLHLSKLFDQVQDINIIDFITKLDCDLILSFILLIKFKPENPAPVSQYIKENSLSLLAYIKSKEFPPNFNWNLVLDYILNTPFFPFIHKLLTLSSLKAFKSTIEPINKFYQNIITMSFKDLLLEIGPESLLPEKLLPSLFQIKPNEIDQGIALILSEILVPGSQGITPGLSSANSLPEANAKGAQLQACFKQIEASDKFNINWYEVFNCVHQNLFEASQRSIQPSIAGITQFLSSLDFKQEPIDIFLNYEWWFSKTLLYILHSLDASQGGYDIALLNNLAYCFEEDKNIVTPPHIQVPARRNILKFINVAKLEVQVIAKIQQEQQAQVNEQERKLNTFLNQLFEHDYRVFPEHILAASLTIIEPTQFIIDLIDTLFSLLMDGDNAAKNKVIKLLAEQGLLLQKLVGYFKTHKTVDAADKTMETAFRLGIQQEILDEFWKMDTSLAVKLLIESSLFGYDVKPVIDAKLNEANKEQLYQAILEALNEKAQKDYERGQAQQPQSGSLLPSNILKIPTVFYLLEKLKTSNGLIDAEKLKNIQLLLLTTYPRLINFGTGHDAAILANEEKSSFFPSEVELEMKSYYSKMYNKEVEIKDIVDMLVKMKVSDDPHQQDVFACMIHSLLDEYKFFSEYPLSALASTSLLFGALLEKDLIQGTTLTVALNFIWESCNQPQDSHLFKFAVQSLYNFKSRLHEYPIYCKHLLECRSLSAHAKMYQIVKDAANGISCASGATHTSTPDVGPRYQSIAPVERIIGFTKQEEPSENIKDRLLFSVNNMTSDNLRLLEIKEMLSETYFSWFSNYLVVDRAKAEPNNHELYSRLVSEFEDPIFFEYILNTSLKEVEFIIRNFKDSRNERNQLKNLGAWLGRITLANDKPLRRDQIALKFLLVESYDFKSLSLIIPFVCKILDQAQYSKVFRPPNPWILGIMKVLVELYECADLKLQLKFEIEVLLNSFKMKIKDIEPSTIVRSHNPNPVALAAMFGINPETVTVANEMSRLSLENQQTLDNVQAFPRAMPAQQVENKFPIPPQQTAVGGILEQQPQQQPGGEPVLDTGFTNLVGTSIFTQNANLRRAFQASLSRAVRECAVPILTRVSEAVLTTTEALIKKDFATEKDVMKLRNSYQKLAQQLSHSMVLCNGRKLLAETIEATMLQLLGNINEVPIVELNNAIQANVGLCVDIIDKIASDNIAELIDDKMKKYIYAREQHNPTEPFVEDGASEFALRLPEPLGLNAAGLTSQQLRIYEKFGDEATGHIQGQEPGIPPQQPQATLVQQQEEAIPIDQLLIAFTQNCERAIQLLSDVSETKLSDLSPNHPIMIALTQALTIAQANTLKYPELLLKAAQYAVNCLFTQTHENPMSNEIYVVILDKLCEYSPSTAKDVTWWLVHSSDQRKFNTPVIFSLLKVQLVQATKLDLSIGKLIKESNNPVVVKFASNLLYNVFTSDEIRPIALRSEFGHTLEALSKYNDQSDDEHKQAMQVRDKLFELLESQKQEPSDQLYVQLGYVFSEWIKLLSHGDENCGELQDEFIKALVESEILTKQENFQIFFKAAIQISVASFGAEHEVRSKTQHETYLAVDALGKLMVKIVLSIDKVDQAINYFRKMMSIVLLNLINDHETGGQNWSERAYFRFFSSLLAAWNDSSSVDDKATAKYDVEFYNYLGDVFNSLQPVVLPGLTFAWVSLVTHRMFLPRLLELEDRLGYATVVKLLTSALKFQHIYSKDTSHDVINVVFKAINRIFIGILHDYPEFFVECHYQLVTAIPRGYIQLRNIVLSASPANIVAPDPFTQGLKVERLPEINDSPVFHFQPMEDLVKVGLKKPVENFLRVPATALLRTIYAGFKLNQPKVVNDFGYEETIHYNVKLINALVLHVGISAVAERSPTNRGFNTKTSQVALLVDLMNYGSQEFRFHLLNAIANQLRYPNSHTHWFIGIILHFFSSNSIWGSPAVKLSVQETITRVLLERRIVSKPHPWGLTIVFTELVKNGDYGFFDLPFVKNSAEEIKNIFDALAINVKGTTSSNDA